MSKQNLKGTRNFDGGLKYCHYKRFSPNFKMNAKLI